MKNSFCYLLCILIISSAISCKKDCNNPPPQEIKTLSLQPGPDDGQDCIVAYRQDSKGVTSNTNQSNTPDIDASAWTYDNDGWWTHNSDGTGLGINRTYLKFTGLDTLSSKITIKSAKLFFHGVSPGEATASPQGNSSYSSAPSYYRSNETLIKRVLSEWNESTITWNNKPATTDANQVEMPASTSEWFYNASDIDVTSMVKIMVTMKQNFGFCLQLKDETIFRSLSFYGSEISEPTARPKLVIEYVEK